jgi:hypothetical protein
MNIQCEKCGNDVFQLFNEDKYGEDKMFHTHLIAICVSCGREHDVVIGDMITEWGCQR